MPEDFETDFGLVAPEDAVIIRPYGGEDDDILLQELRPRFVVMYEPNLAFIRRLEVRTCFRRLHLLVQRLDLLQRLDMQVYKNCNPGLALRVYQMTYTNSFEEDRYLSTMQREAEAFKKLIDDRQVSGIPNVIFWLTGPKSMVIPIYNNNPRAPMRDSVTRSKTTYSSRNAGGGETADDARVRAPIDAVELLYWLTRSFRLSSTFERWAHCYRR